MQDMLCALNFLVFGCVFANSGATWIPWHCHTDYLSLFQELKTVVRNVPEVAEVVGNLYANQVLDVNNQDGEEKVKAVLQLIFTQLMSASKDVIAKALSKLKSRLRMASQVDWNPVL